MDIPALLKRCFYFIVFLPGIVLGQIDDFSDGDFMLNPPWEGDFSKFKVNTSLQLQLNDMDAGQACLFTQIHILEEEEWRFWVKQSFSPSANNFSRLYLMAESGCSMEYPDGIFLQLGEGGSDDAIRLVNQSGGDTNHLISGTAGAVSSSFSCRIRITYAANAWKMYVDYSGAENYISEGECLFPITPGLSYLGPVCNYTSSNSTKFYFDDFYAGQIQHDTIPPKAIRALVPEPDQLMLLFSENLEKESSELAENYFLDNGIGHPVGAHQDSLNPAVVYLHLQDALPYGILHEINIQGIADLAGNNILPSSLHFAYYKPARYDIVVNEIMADPTPAVLLPEYEYIELMNRTPLPVDLTDWTISLGTAEKVITDAHIDPYGYLILGKEEAEEKFTSYGLFYGFESFSLLNSGQDIILSNEKGEPVSGVSYSDSWYQNDEKAEGGWSLEQINPDNPCPGEKNWMASENNTGGTPGRQNSVYDNLNIPVGIAGICCLDSMQIRITFNQAMGMEMVSAQNLFSISHGLGAPEATMPDDPFLNSFILYPQSPLSRGVIYTLSYTSSFINCIGDSVMKYATNSFGLPEVPVLNDLAINEVLFNPFPGGGDFVEVYNRSEKVLDLANFRLISIHDNSPGPPDTTVISIHKACKQLLPGEYALLCSDFAKIDPYYHCPDQKCIIEMETFPSYSNESGIVGILDEQMNEIDLFSYHEDMHFPMLNSVEGVSLERIHYDRPASHSTNWHSASQAAGFASPGYKNSQFADDGTEVEVISISPPIFSPGNDGINDQVNISYKLENPGSLATILIFNTSGQIVRRLVNNELLGTSGSYSWDGINDSGQKSNAGIYIILVELTDIKGKIIRFKETVVVAQ